MEDRYISIAVLRWPSFRIRGSGRWAVVGKHEKVVILCQNEFEAGKMMQEPCGNNCPIPWRHEVINLDGRGAVEPRCISYGRDRE
jgi:hypothetical protein